MALGLPCSNCGGFNDRNRSRLCSNCVCLACGKVNTNDIDYCVACMENDHTGVPTHEVAAVYERYREEEFQVVAEDCGMDGRDLRKYVITQNWAFTGLKVADRIFMALGQNIGELVDKGEVHVVPRTASLRGAMRQIEDEIWAKRECDPDYHISEEEKLAKALELVDLRIRLCEKTPEQAARSDEEWAASKARKAIREATA